MKERKIIVNFFGVIVVFLSVFLSIGYAAFIDSLSIGSIAVKVRPEILTRITSLLLPAVILPI